MDSSIAVLTDRAVVEVVGPEARDFLQRLVTNDVTRLEDGQARYAALLTPQGKITADFFIVFDGSGSADRFLLDVPEHLAAELTKKLKLYRLRAKVEIADRSESLGILAWAAGEAPVPVKLTYADPRASGLWQRGIAERTALASLGDDTGRWAYREQRIRAGVPEGGLDFTYGDTFPHEANLDRLHGVDFKKGCYVGQEVVSRVEHRGTARKRIVRLRFEGEPPPVGGDITLAGLSVGTMGSSIDGVGLGLIRLDRVDDGGPQELLAAGIPVGLEAEPITKS